MDCQFPRYLLMVLSFWLSGSKVVAGRLFVGGRVSQSAIAGDTCTLRLAYHVSVGPIMTRTYVVGCITMNTEAVVLCHIDGAPFLARRIPIGDAGYRGASVLVPSINHDQLSFMLCRGQPL
jgi:hypothetical protein